MLVYRKLGDVCSFLNGFAFKSKDAVDFSEVQLVRMGNLYKNELQLERKAVFYPADFSVEHSKYLLEEGDLIMSLTGTVGKRDYGFVVEIPEHSNKLLMNQRIAKFIDIDETVIMKKYLLRVLRSKPFLDALYLSSNGTRQANLSTTSIKNLEIPLPSLERQKQIVTKLDAAFADIDKAKKHAEQNLKNARELFNSYLQSVFGQKGDDWQDLTLKQASVDFGRGKSKHRPRNDPTLYGGDYPFVQTGDVRGCEHVITTYSKTYNDAGLAQSKLWPKGTICITIAANIAETGILGFDSCFPDSVIGVVVNPEITTVTYMEFLLQSFKTILKAKGKGSAQDNINLGTFEKMTFPFPSLKEQQEIVNVLLELNSSVLELESIYYQKIEALDELKQSILQKAFNGEL